jgi:hypothetical protein
MRNQIDGILLNIDIDVFSMRYRSPDQRLQQVMQWWTGFALPGYQIAQAQGMEYDIQALNRIYASMADLPEINDVALYSMQPQPQSTGVGGPQPIRSPVTTRTNIRQDRGNGSSQLGGETAKNLAAMAAA